MRIDHRCSVRQVLAQFAPGDVLLADRYFCSFFMIALLLSGKCDFVTRLHQCRKTDFSRAQRLGKGDHLVVWKRPEQPDWMDDATLNALWEQITRTARPGARVIFRTAAEPSLLPGRLRPELLDQWDYAEELSRDLTRRDRSAIYGGFHLYVRCDR